MSFDRQLDIFVTGGSTLLVFAGCVFYFAIPVKFAAMIAAGVLVVGLLFGREVVEAIRDVFF